MMGKERKSQLPQANIRGNREDLCKGVKPSGLLEPSLFKKIRFSPKSIIGSTSDEKMLNRSGSRAGILNAGCRVQG